MYVPDDTYVRADIGRRLIWVTWPKTIKMDCDRARAALTSDCFGRRTIIGDSGSHDFSGDYFYALIVQCPSMSSHLFKDSHDGNNKR